MSGFFFINKAFLFGLTAVAIPLLIHLFTKRKARRVEFSTVNFLRDIARRESSRLRVRNLLLMVLRMAVIAAVVLAMARPAIKGPLARGEGSTSIVIVLDNSASMGARTDSKTVFENACRAAVQILDGLNESDEGALLPVCASTSPSLVSGPGRLAGMVGLTELSNRTAPPEASLELGYSLLDGARSINKELYVISDFQATQWKKAGLVIGNAGADVRTTLVSVAGAGHESPGNLYVHQAEIIPSATPSRQTFEFTLVNSGPRAIEAAPVRVYADSVEAGTRYVDVGPSDSLRVGLELDGAPREVRVSLPPDDLEADNEYFVAVQARRNIRVLVVSEDAPYADRDFIGLALSVSGQFVPYRTRPGELSDRDLSQVRCVILDNLARLSPRELELIVRFRQAGGRVLVVLGDRVDIRYYNETLLPELFPVRLVGLQGAKGSAASFFTLRAAIASHPVLAKFSVSRNEPVSAARFFEVITVEPLEGSTVVAQFSEEIPALVEAEGTLLFTSSFESEWNELVTSGAFVPLLHEMLAYLCGITSGRGPDVHPGEILGQGIARPGTVQLPGMPLPGSAQFETLGVYELGGDENESLAFSVNMDPVESDLRYLDDGQLAMLGRGATRLAYDSVAGLPDLERSGQELWPFLVVLSLGFLVAELFVARSAAPPE